MKYTKLTSGTVGLLFASSLTMACGGEEIDHRSIQQNISQSLTNVSQSVVDSIQFLEHSNLFMGAMDSMAGSRHCSGPAMPPDPYTGDDDYGDDYYDDCYDEPVEISLDVDISDERAEAIELLNKHIFATGNIETESREEITYLLRGSVVCTFEDMEPDDRRECTRVVDNAQVRLKVTPAGEQNVNVSLLLGQNRLNPADFEFYREHLGIEVDLGAVKSSITHLANVFGDEAPELPNTFEGRVRLAITKEGPQQVSALAGILRDVRIADGDFELSASRAERAFVVTADAAAQTLAASIALSPVVAKFVEGVGDDYDYDEYPGREPSSDDDREPLRYGLNLGGASLEGVFEATRDVLNLRNLGLGNETTTLDINEQRVFSLDINATAERTFDLTIAQNGDDVEWTVSPSLDLRMAFELIKVRNELEHIADWMLDEVLNIKLDGADAPKIRTFSEGLEVLAGKLTLNAEKANITHIVESNMCLIDGAGSDDDSDCGYDDDGNYDCVYAEPHPFENIAASTCE